MIHVCLFFREETERIKQKTKKLVTCKKSRDRREKEKNQLFWVRFPDRSVGKESACSAGDPGLMPGSGRSPEEGIAIPPVFWGFPCGSAGKESACNARDLGLGRSPGEGKGYPFQYSGLENSMDCIVHGVVKSRTELSDFHLQYTFFMWSFGSTLVFYILKI